LRDTTAYGPTDSRPGRCRRKKRQGKVLTEGKMYGFGPTGKGHGVELGQGKKKRSRDKKEVGKR